MKTQHSVHLPSDAAPRHAPSRRQGLRALFRWLKAFLTAGGWFDRAALVRHFALCAAALVAYLLRFELQAGHPVLWIIAIAALLNLLSFLAADRPHFGRLSRFVSPIFGVGGWTALIYLTGGVSSPFVAGLGLEILLSARTFGLAGSARVTTASVAALWMQQGLLGFEGAARPLIVQTGTLAGIGVITAFLVRHWLREQDALANRVAGVRERLQRLEYELETARTLGKMGENVARLAHGLKNTVHALRGFAALIEKKIDAREDRPAALDGLRAAIDQLDALARDTLGGDAVSGERSKSTPVAGALTGAMAEVSAGYPKVAWRVAGGECVLSPSMSAAALQEILVELFRNAAEAMGGRGEIRVEACASEGCLCIHVRDRGPGVEGGDLNRIFSPGYTTKPGGTGLGLFLARRLAERHGGSLEARPAGGGGIDFCLELALEPSADAGRPRAREAAR